jgi:hypothetical protein
MSFGDLPICRRICQNNIENVPKVYKKDNNTNTRHELKGEKAHNQVKQGLKERRIWTNPNQITLSLHKHHIGSLKRSKGVNPPKMGQFGPSRGAAAPLVAPFGLNFGRLALTASLNVGSMCIAEDLVQRMAVCSR